MLKKKKKKRTFHVLGVEMEFVSTEISQRERVLAYLRDNFGLSFAANGSCDLALILPLQKARFHL